MVYEDTIYKLALENAIKFKGTANPKALVGGVIQAHSEAKSKMQDVVASINKVVDEINSLSLEEQKSKLLELDPDFEKNKQERKQARKEQKSVLRDLPNVDSETGVIMRFAPSPSGPMHLGHAITGGLTSAYMEKYGGKFILRIEDTNSDNIYPPAYDQIPEDASWIFGNVTEVMIQSDRMELYYDYANILLEKEAIYICTCKPDEFKEFSLSGTDCPCRNLSKQEHLQRWQKMFDEYSQGDAVVRFKAGMQNKNPALRDFPLMRINDSEHPRQGKKYRVWPLMNFSVTVDDIESGMTHIIRAKEHHDNSLKQAMIFKVLDKKFPETFFIGRINFLGLELSCSKTKVKIADGIFSGWDDIRIPFLRALKRRGYQAGAFKRFVVEMGISQVDKTVEGEEFFKTINSYNKDIIDPISKRFFAIRDPVTINVTNIPEDLKEFNLAYHPDGKKGDRILSCTSSYYLEKEDHERAAIGSVVRFMDAMNVKKVSDSDYEFVSESYDDFRSLEGKQIIHFVPIDGDEMKAEVLLPDAKLKDLICESNVRTLKPDTVIQFERFAFVRFDHVNEDGTIQFWFTHE